MMYVSMMMTATEFAIELASTLFLTAGAILVPYTWIMLVKDLDKYMKCEDSKKDEQTVKVLALFSVRMVLALVAFYLGFALS